MKKGDALKERFIKTLRYFKCPAQQVAIELHDYDFQKSNFVPFAGGNQ